MKNRQEIMGYLGIEEDNNGWINTAFDVENRYKNEIDNHTVGYGLGCDFYGNQEVLEDFTKIESLEVIEIVNGIVVYKIIYKTEE